MDPIANMITSLKNAQTVGKTAIIPYAKLSLRILELLKDFGYVSDLKIIAEPQKKIEAKLSNKSIDHLARISKPGRRLYTKAHLIKHKPGVLQVISTPLGILTSEQAKKKNVGGELLFEFKSY